MLSRILIGLFFLAVMFQMGELRWGVNAAAMGFGILVSICSGA
jgi:hypothetical protein